MPPNVVFYRILPFEIKRAIASDRTYVGEVAGMESSTATGAGARDVLPLEFNLFPEGWDDSDTSFETETEPPSKKQKLSLSRRKRGPVKPLADVSNQR